MLHHCLFKLFKKGIKFPATQFPLQLHQSNSSALSSNTFWVLSSLQLTSLTTKHTKQHEVDPGHLFGTCQITNMNNQANLLSPIVYLFSFSVHRNVFLPAESRSCNQCFSPQPQRRGCSIPEESPTFPKSDHFSHTSIFFPQKQELT